MLFAVLEFTDFVIIAAIVLVFAGGISMTTRANAASFHSDPLILTRIEQKLDLLLSEFQLDYMPVNQNWQAIADQGPSYIIAAIKAYREETGAGLADAKRAVESYLNKNDTI
jgi:hypothetical protein